MAELEAETSSRTDAAESDEVIKARIAVFNKLAPAFEDDFKFDGLAESELYTEAFTQLTGEAPREDASPEYVAGVVDGILSHLDSEEEGEDDEPVAAVSEAPAEEKEDRADSTVALRQAVSGAGVPQPSAQSSYAQKMADAWKAPLHATR